MRVSVAILAGVAVAASAGQERIDFGHLSLEQGLSQSIIEQIVQDRTGFMWFATEDGLNRFDGYRFALHKNVPGNPKSLSYNELKALHEDREGHLWIGIFSNGLNRFDPITEKVVRYQHDARPTGQPRRRHRPMRPRGQLRPDCGSEPRVAASTCSIARPGSLFTTAPTLLSPAPSATTTCDRSSRIGTERCGSAPTVEASTDFDPDRGVFTVYRHSADDPNSLGHDTVSRHSRGPHRHALDRHLRWRSRRLRPDHRPLHPPPERCRTTRPPSAMISSNRSARTTRGHCGSGPTAAGSTASIERATHSRASGMTRSTPSV